MAVLVVFEGIADIFSKNWSLKGGSLFALAALGVISLVLIFWE